VEAQGAATGAEPVAKAAAAAAAAAAANSMLHLRQHDGQSEPPAGQRTYAFDQHR